MDQWLFKCCLTDAVNSTDALWILPVYVYPGVLHIWPGRWLCLDLRTTPFQGFGKTANERFATRQGRETQDERKLQGNVFKCKGVEHVNGVINKKFVVGGVELKVPILATGS
ncbi:hypothetical protein QC764_408310 [Podospora pseudoanserina]|uniref:Uncharacterized protein n=1 Tax=Podospora pseudoanserina TaxID=2609844 RepID=A0ABR0IAB0_9PEZI|nr:hypothetical protein QC764_408310 [Podospora pseudoanserina]